MVNQKLVNFKNSSSIDIKSNFKSLVDEIQVQHTKVFVSELSNIVAKSSSEVGYKNIVVRNLDQSKQLITALDNQGKGIVSEVNINSSGIVDVTSEMIGMVDGKCHEVLKKFDKNLKKYGVKFSSIDKEYTGGTCKLTSSKMTKIELERKMKDNHIENIRKKTNLTIKKQL